MQSIEEKYIHRSTFDEVSLDRLLNRMKVPIALTFQILRSFLNSNSYF